MKYSFKNIAISGDIGTGKSTLAEKLSQELGWRCFNMGDHFRAWLKERNIPLEHAEKITPEEDRKMDFEFRDRMKVEEGVIFMAHLAGWLAKDSPVTFKILLTVDFAEGMRRVAGRESSSLQQITEKSEFRANALNEKFKKLYNVDNSFDPKYFDLVVDTTNMTPNQVLQYVLQSLPSNQ